MAYEDAFQPPPERRFEPRPRTGDADDASYIPADRSFESPRPTGVLVLAIFHLIIGGFGVLTNTCGLIGLAGGNAAMSSFQPAGQKQQTEQLQASLKANAPLFDVYQAVFVVGMPTVFTVCLIAGGIGLLRMRPWARKLSIGYGVGSILHKALNAIYTLVFLAPIYTTWFRTQALQLPPGTSPQAAQQAQQMMSSMGTIMKATMVISPFIMMIYPVVVLIVLGRPHIVKAFERAEHPAQAPL